MKLKIMILITGTLLGVAYIVGCGGGSNNNNTTCQAGYTWNGSTCVYGAYGTTAYGGIQGNCAATPGTIWSQAAGACVQTCNLNGSLGGIVGGVCTYVPTCGTGYGGGYGYGGGGYGYTGGGYGGAGCNGFQGGPGGGFGPYPMQAPYYYNPYGGTNISWGINYFGH